MSILGRFALRPGPRRRRWALVLVLMMAGLGGLAVSASAAHEAPTLGVSTDPHTEGFGEVAPARIYLGGDPTGLVTDIHWRGWGHRRAIGHGTGWWVPPGAIVAHGHYAPVRVVAWALGHCGGHRAYRKVQWYFPEYNRHGHQPPGTSLEPGLAMKPCSIP
jgi:hypothetical protein